MNFEQFVTDVLAFFSAHLPGLLTEVNQGRTGELPVPDKWEFDVPDVVKHSEAIVFYLIPWDFREEFLSNESADLIAQMKIIITFRKASKEALFAQAHRYMEAVSKLLDEQNSMGGIVSFTNVLGIHYEAELSQGTKAIELNIETHMEI